MVIAVTGFAFGVSKLKQTWKMIVNGRRVPITVHVLNNGYYVSLNDLAGLPGWKVSVDLSTRAVTVDTPGKIEAKKSVPAPKWKPVELHSAIPQEVPKVAAEIKSGRPAGPPSDVRMTAQAAVAALTDLQSALNSNEDIEVLKRKRDATSQTMEQAQNLLWTLPRTKTLQADLQVGFEDLDSQVTLFLASGQAQNGILPWTHPTAQNLIFKYPDLRPCRVTKDKIDGLDMDCAKKAMYEASVDDFSDIERDLGDYR